MHTDWFRVIPLKRALQILGISAIIIASLATVVFAYLINSVRDFDEGTQAETAQQVTLQGYLGASSAIVSSSDIPSRGYFLITSTSEDNEIGVAVPNSKPQISLVPLDTGGREIEVFPYSQVTVQGLLSDGHVIVQSITSDQGQVLAAKTKVERDAINPSRTPTPTRTPTPVPPTPTPGPNIQPIGFHDQANCSNTTGWSCDGDRFSQPLQIHFYADGPAGTGTLIGAINANLPRGQGVADSCGGNANHGFNFTIPEALKDRRIHPIYAYSIGIDSNGVPNGSNRLLSLSPKSILCTTNQQAYPPVNQEAMETQVIQLINSARAQIGLNAVLLNDQLRTAAREHSLDMSDSDRLYFSHYRRPTPPPLPPGVNACPNHDDGYRSWNRIACAGYHPLTFSGEILGKNGYPEGEAAEAQVNWWRTSPTHWQIITDCQFAHIGCGYSLDAGGYHYFTCEFARNGPVPAGCGLTPYPSNPTPPPTATPAPTPTSGPCCRPDPQHPQYLDLYYCPANCTTCSGNIMCGTNGFQHCTRSYSFGGCQNSCGMCQE